MGRELALEQLDAFPRATSPVPLPGSGTTGFGGTSLITLTSKTASP
ncbi:hypothetical protein [Saccharopolyspora hattusasensis]